jgi:hypothetical protein
MTWIAYATRVYLSAPYLFGGAKFNFKNEVDIAEDAQYRYGYNSNAMGFKVFSMDR